MTKMLCLGAALVMGLAVGINGPDALSRDFAAVTLPAIIGIVPTFWAVGGDQARRPRTSSTEG